MRGDLLNNGLRIGSDDHPSVTHPRIGRIQRNVLDTGCLQQSVGTLRFIAASPSTFIVATVASA